MTRIAPDGTFVSETRYNEMLKERKMQGFRFDEDTGLIDEMIRRLKVWENPASYDQAEVPSEDVLRRITDAILTLGDTKDILKRAEQLYQAEQATGAIDEVSPLAKYRGWGLI